MMEKPWRLFKKGYLVAVSSPNYFLKNLQFVSYQFYKQAIYKTDYKSLPPVSKTFKVSSQIRCPG